ncbi:MAG TPA: alpha/beta fold hydrolase [Bryobacteraceae bacterium]|nr:alpha/beta fold hydrolase [Bryobacteraceae bacterium]
MFHMHARRCAAMLVFAVCGYAAPQQFAALGDFRLASGEVIRNCRIGYRTYGQLAADRSNVVLWPTWFTGRTAQLDGMIGAGKLVDPSTGLFVVTVDALGNGVSTSASNSTAQPRMKFPRFTVRDMVESQRVLLAGHLGVKHVHAVIGISMGGMQTFQWVVSHPEFMDAAVPIVGTPRLSASDRLLWSAEANAIRNDREWNGGDYEVQPVLRAVHLIHTFALHTPAWRNRTTAPEQWRELMMETERTAGAFDANDWLRQLEAMLSHDVYAGRGIDEVAKTIRARMLIIVAAQDHMVSPEESLRLAQALKAEALVLSGDCGHLATGCEESKYRDRVRQLLEPARDHQARVPAGSLAAAGQGSFGITIQATR